MKPERFVPLLLAIALAFWVGRRSMWEYELLSRNQRGVTLDMLSMDIPTTVLGLPIDGWVAVAVSATLGACAILRPRATGAPPSADDERASTSLQPGRCILVVVALFLAFWAGHASLWEYQVLASSPSRFTLDMLSEDLPAKHLGLSIACWVMLAVSVTLGATAIRRPRTIATPPTA